MVVVTEHEFRMFVMLLRVDWPHVFWLFQKGDKHFPDTLAIVAHAVGSALTSSTFVPVVTTSCRGVAYSDVAARTPPTDNDTEHRRAIFPELLYEIFVTKAQCMIRTGGGMLRLDRTVIGAIVEKTADDAFKLRSAFRIPQLK